MLKYVSSLFTGQTAAYLLLDKSLSNPGEHPESRVVKVLESYERCDL